MVPRRDFCGCSYSCNFLKGYFHPRKKNSVIYT